MLIPSPRLRGEGKDEMQHKKLLAGIAGPLIPKEQKTATKAGF